VKLFIDYETRSRADLPSVGQHRYAIDESTEILMMAVSQADSDRVLLWMNPAFGGCIVANAEAATLLAKATELHAMNAPFEQAVTWGSAQRGAASPFAEEPDMGLWRCTAAMARKAGLPYSLDKCGEALGLDVLKDKRGKDLIKFFSMPQEDGKFNAPQEHAEKWSQFCEYCRQDVRAEKAIHAKLKAFELVGEPLETFKFDLRLNQRGIPINVAAARNAQKIIDEVQTEVSAQFRQVTGLNPTQRAKVLALVQSLGVKIENMQSETLSALTVDEVIHSPKAARILEMYSKLSYAAVKKVQTMLDCVCPDGKVRGCHLYYGAGTGRWSSKLLQVQNMKKPPRWMKGLTEKAYLSICNGADAKVIDCLFGDPLEVVSGVIRQFVHPKGGLLDGDFNAIEGRIACWIAGQHDILECWRKGEDLYKRAAAFVEGVSESSIQNPSPERDFGKVVELACQFGLGTDGFMRTCDNWGISCDVEKAHRAVHEYYRPTHGKIVARWYMMNDWMREAYACPSVTFGVVTVRMIAGIKYLLLRLPSGRSIAFPHISIDKREPTEKEKEEMAKGKTYPEERFMEITYWGQLQGNTWGRLKLHGALAFQNEVQGIAADCMAHGGITCEQRGMEPFMLIHDQSLSHPHGHTVPEYEAALGDLPSWAKGLPLKVEAKAAKYYRK
jgi:DNA polymerase